MKNKDALGSPNRFGHNWKKFSNLTQFYEEQLIVRSLLYIRP